MSPADRNALAARLRLVAERYYNGTLGTHQNLTRCGICYALQYVEDDTPHASRWYEAMRNALDLFGVGDIKNEDGGGYGDWTVRPLFCLLMADALEQME